MKQGSRDEVSGFTQAESHRRSFHLSLAAQALREKALLATSFRGTSVLDEEQPKLTYIYIYILTSQVDWPTKNMNFLFTTKNVFPKSLKSLNSGSEYRLKLTPLWVALPSRRPLWAFCEINRKAMWV